MKDCRCGRRIPDDWPNCAECLKYDALSPDQAANRTNRRRTRKVKVFRHMTKRERITKRLAEIISAEPDSSTPEVQEQAILAIRKDMKARESNRAAKALREWGAGE